MTRAAIKHNEEQLRRAMLEADIEALDRLVHDELLFLGPTGAIARKADDLGNYEAARQHITRIEPRDLTIELFGADIAVVAVLTELEGSFDGAAFAGTFRYLRTWRREDGDWKVIAGAVTPVAG